MRLEKNHSLRAVAARSNDWFWPILPTTRKIKQSKESDQNWSMGKGVVFHHNNVRPFLATRQKLRELGWEVSTHPLYSSDLAQSDHHLFLQNSLNSIKLTSKKVSENCFLQFLSRKRRILRIKLVDQIYLRIIDGVVIARSWWSDILRRTHWNTSR